MASSSSASSRCRSTPFLLLYCGFTQAYILGAIALFAYPLTTNLAGLFTFFTVSVYLRRSDALAHADRLVADDVAAYEKLWQAKSQTPDLVELRTAWAEVMETAVAEPKVQPTTFGSLEALYNACDLLNEVFLCKMKAVSDTHLGTFWRANVKSEDRALQKIYRSYSEDWRRLTDINRCAIGFGDFNQMATCLRAISADPEIVLLRMAPSKMRFSENYDAASASGGYRDVQLSVRIDTAWTRMHGLERILCEVQLHDLSYADRKTNGGGHAAYVARRNMIGS